MLCLSVISPGLRADHSLDRPRAPDLLRTREPPGRTRTCSVIKSGSDAQTSQHAPQGWTCLHHAALQKNMDTVKFLLDDKASGRGIGLLAACSYCVCVCGQVGARTYARSTQNKMAVDIAEHINTRNLLRCAMLGYCLMRAALIALSFTAGST